MPPSTISGVGLRMRSCRAPLEAEEEAVHEADLHDQTQAEDERADARPYGEASIDDEKRHAERKRQERRDHGHPRNGPQAEEQQIGGGGVGTITGMTDR